VEKTGPKCFDTVDLMMGMVFGQYINPCQFSLRILCFRTSRGRQSRGCPVRSQGSNAPVFICWYI